MLVGLDEVLYSGLPLPRDEEWALRNAIVLRNLFGSTECGTMLLSVGGKERNASLLRPLEGMSGVGASGDCPDVSLRHPDGDFHSGDLLQERVSGYYVFRGRDDDWIKTENSLRCDIKSERSNRGQCSCGRLIAECVVVETGRPFSAMFTEPATDMDHDKLKREIIGKTRHFHERRYVHERIDSVDMIFIVAPQTLPRTTTKGNIPHKAVEEALEDQLDRTYRIQH
ncbi:hypothetical protein H2248_000738 [Termitomyces sp. 'cryptogamus']|nr:hypothetical protein H2248_000738 [Termitomyces sp. 'cryptogamus']